MAEVWKDLLKPKGKVQKAIEAGDSLEEVKGNSEITANYDATHGGGFISAEAIRETFYNSLRKNKPSE